MKNQTVITVNWNDSLSIKKAEKMKAQLENSGYVLKGTESAFSCSKMFYEKA
jgi:hypothetical protein